MTDESPTEQSPISPSPDPDNAQDPTQDILAEPVSEELADLIEQYKAGPVPKAMMRTGRAAHFTKPIKNDLKLP